MAKRKFDETGCFITFLVMFSGGIATNVATDSAVKDGDPFGIALLKGLAVGFLAFALGVAWLWLWNKED